MKKIIKIAVLILLLLAFYSFFLEPSFLVVTQHDLMITDLPEQAENLKIVQFSDTHLKNARDVKRLAHVVDKINAQKADIVVFCGDLFDNYKEFEGDEQQVIAELARLQAKLGCYSIYGNHDQGGGASRFYSDLMEQAGFTLLVNASVNLPQQQLTIFGVDDALLSVADLTIAQKAQPQELSLMLAHEPDICAELGKYDLDLILSGHTHGGQISLPIYGPVVLPPLGKEYVGGLYELASGETLFVNRGIGTSMIDARFLAIPEIAVFTLQARQ